MSSGRETDGDPQREPGQRWIQAERRIREAQRGEERVERGRGRDDGAESCGAVRGLQGDEKPGMSTRRRGRPQARSGLCSRNGPDHDRLGQLILGRYPTHLVRP